MIFVSALRWQQPGLYARNHLNWLHIAARAICENLDVLSAFSSPRYPLPFGSIPVAFLVFEMSFFLGISMNGALNSSGRPFTTFQLHIVVLCILSAEGFRSSVTVHGRK